MAAESYGNNGSNGYCPEWTMPATLAKLIYLISSWSLGLAGYLQYFDYVNSCSGNSNSNTISLC